MSTLKLNVKTTKQFIFEPNKLELNVISSDIKKGTSVVFYKLIEEGLNKQGYIAREWTDNGNVEIPSSALAEAYIDGELNILLLNQILAPFNLEIDTTVQEPEQPVIP